MGEHPQCADFHNEGGHDVKEKSDLPLWGCSVAATSPSLCPHRATTCFPKKRRNGNICNRVAGLGI